jgi:hypothetical protein
VAGLIQPVGLLEVGGWASELESQSSASVPELAGGVLALIE